MHSCCSVKHVVFSHIHDFIDNPYLFVFLVMMQKQSSSSPLCDSYTGCCRDFAATHTVGVAEILQSLIQYECSRNSATFYTRDAAEILGPFIHWVLQKFCDHSYTGYSRNSTTIHTLDVAEIPRPFTHKHDRTDNACTVSTSRCSLQSLRKVS